MHGSYEMMLRCWQLDVKARPDFELVFQDIIGGGMDDYEARKTLKRVAKAVNGLHARDAARPHTAAVEHKPSRKGSLVHSALEQRRQSEKILSGVAAHHRTRSGDSTLGALASTRSDDSDTQTLPRPTVSFAPSAEQPSAAEAAARKAAIQRALEEFEAGSDFPLPGAPVLLTPARTDHGDAMTQRSSGTMETAHQTQRLDDTARGTARVHVWIDACRCSRRPMHRCCRASWRRCPARPCSPRRTLPRPAASLTAPSPSGTCSPGSGDFSEQR